MPFTTSKFITLLRAFFVVLVSSMATSGLSASPQSDKTGALRLAPFGEAGRRSSFLGAAGLLRRPRSPHLPTVAPDCDHCLHCRGGSTRGGRERNSRINLAATTIGGNVGDAGEEGPPTEEKKAVAAASESSSSSSLWPILRERLLKVSSIASLLCVIDCTVLPAVTLLLPLVGLATTPAQSAWLHELGHSVALFFVLPVGGLAASLNFLSHRRMNVSLPALLGLCLIFAANAPHGAPVVSLLPHDVAHALHCGSWVHRTTNLAGCALLLSSNYVSHRMGCAASGLSKGNCGHDHDHSHDHGGCS